MIDATRIIPLFSKQFSSEVINQIQNAIFSIDICIYDWRTYPTSYGVHVTRFNRAIHEAVGRGVKVRVVLNSIGNAARLKMLGCDVRKFNSNRILHTKLMIIDRSTIICGSHNYSESAFNSNEELSLLCIYEDEPKIYTEYFERVFTLGIN